LQRIAEDDFSGFVKTELHILEGFLEFGLDVGLLTNFVCGDAVKLIVAFYRDYIFTICVDGVISAFPE
jgi:hypothetical protein